MKKTVTLASGRSSRTRRACLAVYIQHTREQYGLPTCASREPTHWIKATDLTGFGKPVRSSVAKRHSISSDVMTLGYWP